MKHSMILGSMLMVSLLCIISSNSYSQGKIYKPTYSKSEKVVRGVLTDLTTQLDSIEDKVTSIQSTVETFDSNTQELLDTTTLTKEKVCRIESIVDELAENT